MAKLASATVFINTELGEFAKGIKQAEKETRASVGNIVSTLNSVGKGMTAAGLGIVGAIGGMAKGAVDLGSQIADLSSKTGLSTEAISELSFAAKLSGGDIGSLDVAMKGMAKSLDAAKQAASGAAAKMTQEQAKAMEDVKQKAKSLDAQYKIAVQRYREMEASGKGTTSQFMAQRAKIEELGGAITKNRETWQELSTAQKSGGEEAQAAAGAYARLGLNINDLDKMNPDEKFMTMAKAVAEVKDPTERAALAMQVFGKGGDALLPMLAQGAAALDKMRERARQMGFSFSTETIAKMDEFGDTIDTMKMGLQAAGMSIIEQLMPQLQQLAGWLQTNVQKMVDWIKANPEQVAAIGELAMKIGGFLVIAGPLTIFLGQVVSGFTLMKNVIMGIVGITKFLPWIQGIIGTVAGGGFAGLASTIGLIVGAAGIGWAIGRWIDSITENTAFGRWIDSMMDKLVAFIDKIKTALGFQDELARKNAAIKVGAGSKGVIATLPPDIPGNAEGTNFWRGGLTWVGERGRELVNLPKGSEIVPNKASERMAAGMGGVKIGTVNVTTSANDTPRAFLQRFNEAMRLKERMAGA